MDNLKTMFGTKVGPLPAIAWAGMLAFAYVVYRYATANRDTTSTTVETVGMPMDDVGSADDFMGGYGNATGSYVVGPGGGTSAGTQPPPGIADNTVWYQRAFNYLVSTGAAVADVQKALASYLYQTGDALNSTQQAAWQRAVEHLGAPPEPITTTPPTKPPPPSHISGSELAAYSHLGDNVIYTTGGKSYALTWDNVKGQYKFGPDAPPTKSKDGSMWWPGGSSDGYIRATNSLLRRA